MSLIVPSSAGTEPRSYSETVMDPRFPEPSPLSVPCVAALLPPQPVTAIASSRDAALAAVVFF
ncbi:hypothetical protein ACFTAO_41210 [Paenibacillus rhizoplanae]